MKGLVLTTFTVMGLQGMAFASTRTQAAPAAIEKYAPVQASDNSIIRDSKAVPVQVALRLKSGLRINSACDDTGLPCPRG
ncbi:hypothetical protein [Pseudomonas syringae]|uniref:hypothetical protein n=1 Tax=Pseudomonas syringae TaxID=317 RepID=UPI000BB6162F|nr:hypothetical protein [Pseudomonas syringae]PBP44410.1 hypothetical protein CCL13_17130 [Pseudomonas syringae]